MSGWAWPRIGVTAIAALTLVLGANVIMSPASRAAGSLDFSTAEAGNPIVDGWYADPDAVLYGDTYWIYPTASKSYDEQTYLDAFSSTDLVHWTKHANVLTTANVSWAKRALWAPAPVQRNGKYYLYFGANDIQSNSDVGGIGVAVASSPAGPYVDAIGKPLIGQYANGAQPIDQDVFIDDDGQAYIYYGGHGHANVAKLGSDMVSLQKFSDGSTFKEITPSGYTEGAQMFKRNGRYYLMWSEGDFNGPDYSVSYAIANSPTGPFTKLAKILQQDDAVGRGAGHNGVINIPGTDTWYIVYHRRPLGDTEGNHRQLAYDRMYFNADGTIQSVKMLVKDNFEDGNALGWQSYNGSWTAGSGTYSSSSSFEAKSLLNDAYANVRLDTDVTIKSGDGDAGVVFRATSPTSSIDGYKGYYAAISTKNGGSISLGKANNNWTSLKTFASPIKSGQTYHLRVTAVGSTIQVFVDNLSGPKLTVSDSTYSTGATGVRLFNTSASFDNVAVDRS